MGTVQLVPFEVTAGAERKCRYCGGDILWLLSTRTQRRYPVDVKMEDGKAVSQKNWFHKCDEEKKRAYIEAQRVPEKPPALYRPRKDSMVARKEAMQKFVAEANEPQIREALWVLYQRQTAMEKEMKGTYCQNGRGFSGHDSNILSDIAEKSRQYGRLTVGQAELVRKRLRGYAKQLVLALEAGEWKLVEPPAEQLQLVGQQSCSCDCAFRFKD